MSVLRPSGSFSWAVEGAWAPTLGTGATSLAAGVLRDSSSAQKPDLGVGVASAMAMASACARADGVQMAVEGVWRRCRTGP